ncbi:hypothetical protein LTR28_006170 [Elasticomyces elasticus]|nr:hypothetical protein LTR28_006170 [Elasticomyces elasticus]
MALQFYASERDVSGKIYRPPPPSTPHLPAAGAYRGTSAEKYTGRPRSAGVRSIAAILSYLELRAETKKAFKHL